MASLYTPQSQAGVLSFYDAPTNGPKMSPKVLLVIIVVFAVVILAIDHFIYAA